jgi:hypothetical protein
MFVVFVSHQFIVVDSEWSIVVDGRRSMEKDGEDDFCCLLLFRSSICFDFPKMFMNPTVLTASRSRHFLDIATLSTRDHP